MLQTLLTIFEDRKKKLTLTPSQVEDILSFRSMLGENRLSLSCDGVLHVRHLVGFICKGKTRLQILPKVYENTGFEDEVEQREYIPISENSSYIKGHINFVANLRENPIRKDLHIVNFQSFEHDNLINNIIKTVCVKLIRLTGDADNKKKLKKALIFLDDAKEIFLSKDLFDSARFTRLNKPFKPVFEMAKMFFQNLTPQSYHGDDTVCSFLISLNELFEFYLYKLFDAFGEGMTAVYQSSHSFAHGQDNDFRVTIRPDIILRKGKQPILIADAKYKNPRYKNGVYTDISITDMYQIFAYAKVYNLETVALIYPQFENNATPPMSVELGEADVKVRLIVGCVDIRNADIQQGSLDLRNMLLTARNHTESAVI
jgi:5-methylcytosine-specific restriction enzyme subunit McrC